MKVEEGKIKKMQEKVSSNLKQQEDKIQERIKLRKMKSETYSSRKL